MTKIEDKRPTQNGKYYVKTVSRFRSGEEPLYCKALYYMGVWTRPTDIDREIAAWEVINET